MKNYVHKVSLEEYQSPSEIQQGSDCTVHAVVTAIENRFNQLGALKEKLNLDEIKAGQVASQYWGRHKTWIFHHGGNSEIVAKSFEKYDVPEDIPELSIRLNNVRQIEKTKKKIIQELSEGRALVYAGLGKMKTIGSESWFVATTGVTGHAMCLDTIYYDDTTNDDDFVVEFQNTMQSHFRTKMTGKDFLEMFGHIYSFDILLNGKIMSQDSATQENKNFVDIDYLSDSDQDLIEEFVDAGVIKGYSDATFRPNNNLTRLELLYILKRLGVLSK